MKVDSKKILYSVCIASILTSCAIRKPCAEGGDISWSPKIDGDKKCTQKKLPNGKIVNDGPFKQAYRSTNEIALEGQFELGQKQGIWLFYGEDRKLKTAKFFEKGVEKTPPPAVQKEIDLIIQQKTSMK
jgi:hypothetical protein